MRDGEICMQRWLEAAYRTTGISKRLGPVNAKLNHSLICLRDSKVQGDLSQFVEFFGGASLRADPKMELTGRFNSPQGRVLELEASIHHPGNWIALHFPLRKIGFHKHGALGFTCRGYAPEPCTLRVCLRSCFAETFVDSFFHKHVLLNERDDMHVDAMCLQARQHVPETCKSRELVVFLPSSSFRLSLLDFRIFVV